MIGLIDGDIVAFRCAATCNNEPLKIAIYRMEDMLDNILSSVQSKTYKMYLTGKNNFRKKIDPEYKANRKDSIPPIHLSDCREFLSSKWNAITTNEIEADDALGIEQCLSKEFETVICSIDKDLLQIPGYHFNFLHNVKTLITEEEGYRHFYSQMLIGDRSDNVTGVRGIGKVKAAKLLDPLDNEQDMFDCVKSTYDDDTRFVKNCNLLWIQKKENELWENRSNHLYETTECESERQESSEMGKRSDT